MLVPVVIYAAATDKTETAYAITYRIVCFPIEPFPVRFRKGISPQLALELGQCGQDIKLELPGGRHAVDAIAHRDERHADMLQVVEHRHEVE